jgi:hypothetical protein
MHPVIRDGETIHVEPAAPGDLQPGDIALYRWERGVRAHRIVRIEHKRQRDCVFTLRGDACSSSEIVQAPEVFGKVTSVERSGSQFRLNGTMQRARNAIHRVLRQAVGLTSLSENAHGAAVPATVRNIGGQNDEYRTVLH